MLENYARQFELLEEQEFELLEQDNSSDGYYAKLISLYQKMRKPLYELKKAKPEEYATTFHEIEKRLIVTYILYGTYMKTSSKKDPRSAKMALEKVLNSDKHNPIANYRLGFLAYQDEQYFKALRYFQTALHCESKLEPNEFKLNETQLYYAQLYSANSALYIAQQSQQVIEQFTQQPKPLTYESSPLLSLIERNEGYLTEHAFYRVTRNTKETCSIDDCSQILEDDLKKPHLILYFADRGPIIKYFGEERSINYPDADILFHLLTKHTAQHPGSRHHFTDYVNVRGNELSSNTFRKKIGRLNALLNEIGLMDGILQTRVNNETAYYFNPEIPYIILYRVDDMLISEAFAEV